MSHVRTLLQAVLVAHLIVFGLGTYVVFARVPELEALGGNLELLGLGACLVALLLRVRSGSPLRPEAHHVALGVYLGVLVLGLVVGPGAGEETTLAAFGLYTAPFVAYALGALVVGLPDGASMLLRTLAVALVLMALPALLEAVWGLRSNVAWVDPRFEDTSTRVTGILANPIILASVFQMGLGWMSGWLAVEGAGRGERVLRWALVGLSVLLLFLSYTRAGWAAAVVGCFVAWWLAGRRRTVVLAPALLLVALVVLSPGGRDRVGSTASLQHRSTATRLDRWSRALHQSLERPLVGRGLGTTCGVAPNNAGLPGAYYAHAYLMQVQVELGLVGLVPFVAFWVLAIRSFLGRGRGGLRIGGVAALAGLGVHSLVIGHLEYRPVAVLVGLTLALLDAPLPGEGGEGAAGAGGWRRRVLVAAPGLVGLAFLCVLQVRVDCFQRELERAMDDARGGRVAQARERLAALRSWSPRFLEAEHRLVTATTGVPAP